MTLAVIFGLLGAFVGWLIEGRFGAIAGACLAGAIGWKLAAASRRASASAPRYGARATSPPDAVASDAVLARLAAIEARLARLEAHARLPDMETTPAPQPSARGDANAAGPSMAAPTDALQTNAAEIVPVDKAADLRARGTANAVWAWFTGGHSLTRIGVVALFFGVAFLLRWFAERLTVPIEWRLLGVAAAGMLLLVIGWRIRSRPAYGLALQGAGAGILYLTTFAAFRLYAVLPVAPAFALLVLVSVASVALALRRDSQAMAALAFAGGFLAPILVSRGGGEPVPLFAYLALLNGCVFLIAWRRAWRALNALGFVFTFALALAWGFQYYRPQHFATVEPFLGLFFAFYLTMAILEGSRSDPELRKPVDALLVFGVPASAFALQHGLVRDYEYGEAWTALALAGIYGALAWALRVRRKAGLSLLGRAFLVIAIVFASVAIPFAVDARHTAAWWAVEAAGAYWLGCVQRQGYVRVAAILLQLAAAAFLLSAGPYPGERTMFANAGFLGAVLIGMSALATSWQADRDPERLGPREHSLRPWIFAWGVGWWIAAGVLELAGQVMSDLESHAALAWVAGSAFLALAISRALQWPRIASLGLVVLPAMAIVAAEDLDLARTTLLRYGWIVWPLAWASHFATMRAIPISSKGERGVVGEDAIPWLHALSAVLVVAHLAWEAGEWTGRVSAEGTSWITAATAIPAIAYLAWMTLAEERPAWPLRTYSHAYRITAGTVIAALLAAWFLLANVLSPGDPDPLPYFPLANPLDLALGLALAVAWSWSSRVPSFDDRARYGLLGIAVFVMLNGIVVRSVHHWLDVPWRFVALVASKPLQAALTLTWTATALPLMLLATRRRVRPLWMIGAALLVLVVVKLFVLDLAALSGLPRVVAFLGVGALLLVIGYAAPLPPAPASRSPPESLPR